MIRINLLPFKETTLIQWGQRQVLIFAGAVLAAVLACFIYYNRMPDPEAQKKRLIAERSAIEQQIRTVQGQTTCNQEEWRDRLTKANRKYRTVERLITQRRTPKFVLRELSRVLSEAWGPTLKPAFANQDKRTLYNQNWDPSGVWITRFEEKDRQVKIEGGSKASDDVAEFWRRLQMSAYFGNVELEKFNKVDGEAGKEKTAHLRFSIFAAVNY